MTFVLAGTHAEALRFSSKQGWDWTHILTQPMPVLGLKRGTEVVLVGTWYNRSDWDQWDRVFKQRFIKRRYPTNEEGF